MNNTTNKKLIKKKFIKKSNINKLADDELVPGTVLKPQKQTPKNEEKVVKKKRKIKKLCETETTGAGEDHLNLTQQQQYQEEKIEKKKPKVKKNTDIKTPVTVLEPCGLQQEKPNIKKKLKVQQSSKKCQQTGTIKMAVKHTTQIPTKQQAEEIVREVKESSITPAETVLNQHSLEQQQPDLEYYHRKAYIFMKTLKRDYKRLALIYNSCLKAEQEREQRNEHEIDELKRQYNQMQVERTNIKRKRWCRYCESEATYLSTVGTNFYCSQSCEQKQNDLVSAMEGSF